MRPRNNYGWKAWLNAQGLSEGYAWVLRDSRTDSRQVFSLGPCRIYFVYQIPKYEEVHSPSPYKPSISDGRWPVYGIGLHGWCHIVDNQGTICAEVDNLIDKFRTQLAIPVSNKDLVMKGSVLAKGATRYEEHWIHPSKLGGKLFNGALPLEILNYDVNGYENNQKLISVQCY